MADNFFDTSAITKHYRAEVGTPEVDALLSASLATNLISALSVVELHSVFARLVRTGQITMAEFQLAVGRFVADIAANLWHVVPVANAHFQQAQQLVMQHGPTRNLRTLDALQLAVALDFSAALAHFVCADTSLCQVATIEGLAVLNPEAP